MEIWKYRLEVEDLQKVEVPEGAQFLSLIEQAEQPTLYFLVNPEQEKKAQITFAILGTGKAVDVEFFDRYRYLGTISTLAGRLIWHIFVLVDDSFAFIHWPARPMSHAMTRV